MLVSLQTLILIAVTLTAGVFVCAFRVALRYQQPPNHPQVPRAVLHSTRLFAYHPWHRDSVKQRLLHSTCYLEAAIVALAVTSVFVTFLCLVGVLISGIIGAL